MADRKIPCADCDDCVPCEMVERCIKHDPVPPTFDNYTKLTAPAGTQIEPCPVCAADPEVWQYIAKEGDVAQKVVMCSHDDEIGPYDALAGGGCPLYMPPQSFYRPTIREAVNFWNEYGKALGTLRRKNGWKRAQVLRGSAASALSPSDGKTQAGDALSEAAANPSVAPSNDPTYFCNKCGYFGPVQVFHQRPNGSGKCDYMASLTGPSPAPSPSDVRSAGDAGAALSEPAIHAAIEAARTHATYLKFEGDGQFGMFHEANRNDPKAHPHFTEHEVWSIIADAVRRSAILADQDGGKT